MLTAKIIIIIKDSQGNDMEVFNSDFQTVKDDLPADITSFLKPYIVPPDSTNTDPSIPTNT